MTIKALIKLMRTVELLVRDVYGIYAAIFPESAGLWEQLAHEEEEHALLFTLMLKLTEDESIYFENIDDTADATNRLIKSLQKLIANIRDKKGNISLYKALKSALDIEVTAGEQEQFRGLKTSSDSLRSYMNRIAAANRAHIQLITDELKKHETPI